MNIDIEKVKDFIEDPNQYPSSKGFRDVGSPAFVYFDDSKGESSDESWMKAEAVKFEEWLKRKPDYVEPNDQDKVDKHLSRIEQLRRNNWLVGWEKRKTTNNDHWRKLVMPLIQHMDHPEHGEFCKEVIRAIRDNLPFAPGPIAGTTFINPDGSRYVTSGTDYGKAKASFAARHKLNDEFISVERVQFAHEKVSRIVVGTRRTSDRTMSHYYDPNPTWSEKLVDNEWVKAYQPSANNLYRICDERMTMPFGSHRLTVREFEQAVIAGAETFEDDDENFAFQIENSTVVDHRISTLDFNNGRDGKAIEGMHEYEQELFGMLFTADKEFETELDLLVHGISIKAAFYNEHNPITFDEVFNYESETAYTPAAKIIRKAMMMEGYEEEEVEVIGINAINGHPQVNKVVMKVPGELAKFIWNSIAKEEDDDGQLEEMEWIKSNREEEARKLKHQTLSPS